MLPSPAHFMPWIQTQKLVHEYIKYRFKLFYFMIRPENVYTNSCKWFDFIVYLPKINFRPPPILHISPAVPTLSWKWS